MTTTSEMFTFCEGLWRDLLGFGFTQPWSKGRESAVRTRFAGFRFWRIHDVAGNFGTTVIDVAGHGRHSGR